MSAAPSFGGRLARRLLDLTIDEAYAALDAFHVDPPELQARVALLARVFHDGYVAALDERLDDLAPCLERVDSEMRSFAFEGAGTALAALDALSPWPAHRLRRFLGGGGAPHAYIIHIGAGWAMARLPRLAWRILNQLDPVLRWLAYDGLGFHEGFFASQATLERREVPRWVMGYARRAFDLGVGRSIWFAESADPERIARRIAGYPAARWGELWSGVGLACAYAGGGDAPTLGELARVAAAHAPCLAQGAAFAAESRVRAGERAAQTALACRVFCGLELAEAAALVGEAGRELPADGGDIPPFEVWRRRVQERISQRRLP